MTDFWGVNFFLLKEITINTVWLKFGKVFITDYVNIVIEDCWHHFHYQNEMKSALSIALILGFFDCLSCCFTQKIGSIAWKREISGNAIFFSLSNVCHTMRCLRVILLQFSFWRLLCVRVNTITGKPQEGCVCVCVWSLCLWMYTLLRAADQFTVPQQGPGGDKKKAREWKTNKRLVGFWRKKWKEPEHP